MSKDQPSVAERSNGASVASVAILLCCIGCSAPIGDTPKQNATDRSQTSSGRHHTEHDKVPPSESGTIASGNVSPHVVESLRSQAASTDETTRADAMRRLGEIKDVDSFVVMLDGLEDASPLVRQNAYKALCRLSNLRVPFDADGSPDDRRQAVEFYRNFWEEHMDPDGPFMQVSKDPSLKYTKYGQKK